MTTLTIDEVYKKDEHDVVLLNFQNGYPKDDIDAPAVALEDENGKITMATYVDDLLYKGQESTEELGKTLLIVRNKDTGKTRILEVRTVDLKPSFKIDVETALLPEPTYNDLQKTFGSKRSKKALEQSLKLKQNETAVAEQMKNVSKNISKNELDISVETSLNKSANTTLGITLDYVPTCNRDASNIKDVYLATSMLTQEEISQIAMDIELADIKLIPTLQKHIKTDSTIETKVLALYAHTLFDMSSKTMQAVGVRSYVACPHSLTLNKHVLDKFTVTNPSSKRTASLRNRPIQYRDMAICHALVATFLVSNYKFDLGELSVEVKQSLRSLTLKVVLIGGQVVNKNGMQVAVLKLPLNTPKVRKSFTPKTPK